MASFGKIENFQVKINQNFLDKASELEPGLYKREVVPKYIVEVSGTPEGVCVKTRGKREELKMETFQKGDTLTLDFGEHLVGYATFTVVPVGSHFDAPAYLRLKFAEVPGELLEKSEDYNGWLSSSWIQEEYLHLDILPAVVHLPRRYAFRYLRIEVLDTSSKYQVKFQGFRCDAVSAVEVNRLALLVSGDELLDQMDRISVKTLAECMQSVFEDGVKRDRRLWLGDLRLQALANYVTFQNYDMVKRCLYLFAGMTFSDGRIGACFFHEPEFCVDDTYLMDYALLFCPTLLEYYESSGDLETLQELYPKAMEQIDICIGELDENHVVKDRGDEFWCFLDWSDGLNKQAGAQAVLIYAMRYGIRMAQITGDLARVRYLEEQICLLKESALQAFWDEEKQLFASGSERQISWATQIWMCLAGVFDEEKRRELLIRTILVKPDIHMVTPYMYHYYIDALISCGERELALDEMKRYWGGMIRDGADTFWELYNPNNKNESPYGSCMVNSYCHAWSCTPTYFLRKYYFH